MIEITLTVLAAYGSFGLAEALHLSGVIATVAAGLSLGRSTRELAFSEDARRAADALGNT